MFSFFRKKEEKNTSKIVNPDRPKPVVLAILDGWGVAQNYSGNAITQASLTNFPDFIARYPATTLRASGESVGLPWGKEGNSEVGHLNIGLGRIIYQDLPRINRSISDGSFAANPALLGAFKHVENNKSKLHIMGLVSNGGIHSSIEHLRSLLTIAKKQGIDQVYVHAFLDGRDTPYNSAMTYITDLERAMTDLQIGKIASLSGRFYAMDRDNHWDRIEKTYLAMTEGKGNMADSAADAITASYKKKIYDEEFVPTVIKDDDWPTAVVSENDALIFFNFRPDRARQITKAFVLPGFDKFSRDAFLKKLYFVSMTEYERDLPVEIAFPLENFKNSLGEVLSKNNFKQLRIAETEKYAHVTYFFNGGREAKSPGEDHDLIPSPSVDSYALLPEMAAIQMTDKVVKVINENTYDFILINFANTDMVGHTGDLAATIKATEAVDKCIGKISRAILAKNGIFLITADHGNAEIKVNMQTGQKSKEHTTNPVPFLVIGNEFEGKKIGWAEAPGGDLSLVQPIGILSDIAPTILKILKIDQPMEITGKSLL